MTTASVAVVYVACVTVLNLVFSAHLTAEASARLTARVDSLSSQPAQIARQVSSPGPGSGSDDTDDGPPVLAWLVGTGGHVVARTPGAPSLPATLTNHVADAQTTVANLGASGAFRLKTARNGAGFLVVGLGLAPERRIERWLLAGEAGTGPVLLLAMFAGSLLIGLRAQAPVEQARRRQLEFTADASHELRTPLSVIQAETDLALAIPRQADDYQDTLTSIRGETDRLRSCIEDCALAGALRLSIPAPRPGPGRPDRGCPGVRGTAPLSRHRRRRRRRRYRARSHYRTAGLDPAASRGAPRQRLPVRRAGRSSADRRCGQQQPRHAESGRQRPWNPPGPAAPAVRPVLARD